LFCHAWIGGESAQAKVYVRVLNVVLLLALTAALACCAGTTTDRNEPNDELGDATALTPGSPVRGTIGNRSDSDVFRAETPPGDTVHEFTVTVLSAASQDIDVHVGARIPGTWEGISWPDWRPHVEGDRVWMNGSLKAGTVYVVLEGRTGASYSIDITWR
jgi:hypothetical protein